MVYTITLMIASDNALKKHTKRLYIYYVCYIYDSLLFVLNVSRYLILALDNILFHTEIYCIYKYLILEN